MSERETFSASDTWSDDTFTEACDLFFEDLHPIEMARRLHRPIVEVHAFWRRMAESLDDDLLPPRIVAARQRTALAP